MIIKDETELNLKRSRTPLESVEIDVGSLESQGKVFPEVLCKSLAQFAQGNVNTCLSIYIYFTTSCNFHELTNSFFIGAVGNKKILDFVFKYFSSISGVRVKVSDHINPSESTLDYHVECGYVWRRYEPGSWWADEKKDL